ncbi:MAG TPA: right-handed parallel beta-helix repeat-containing protein, partial [Elusimicrobiales bacterium]|nr:right-handed parallel beta-helix repeat-containing protein [Elusimicrobiales bacterium]
SSEQNTIRYNTIFENLGGIVLQCDSGADLNVVEFNIIYSNYVNGISVLNDGNSGFNHIRHNTIFHSPSGSNTPAYVGHGIAIEGGKRVYISNNLIVNYINDSDSHGVLLVTTDAVQIRIDNNLIYCPNGGYIGGSSTDLATWKSDNQTDAKITNLSGVSASASANDISSDPFLNAAYGIAGNSPAKDKGAVLYTYAAHPGDYYGRKIYGDGPDIGAVEKKVFFEDFLDIIFKKCATTDSSCYTQLAEKYLIIASEYVAIAGEHVDIH